MPINRVSMKRKKTIRKVIILHDKDLVDIEDKIKVGISVRRLALWWDIPHATFRRILIQKGIIK